MRTSRLLALSVLLALTNAASAQDGPDSGSTVIPRGFEQVVYKGLVGNVLDAVPMDPSDRLGLQRTNAVVSNALLGRSLAVMAGLSNPVLLLGGFAWGVWSATNIRQMEADLKRAAEPGQSGGLLAAAAPAVLDVSAALNDALSNAVVAPVLVSSNSGVAADALARSRPRVIRIWLPQRSTAQSP